MRTKLIAAAAAGLMVMASGAQAQGSGAAKVGYVNTQVLMEQTPGRAQADSALSRELGAMQQQVQRMQDSLNALVTVYQRDEKTMTAAQREARQTAIRRREEEYRGRTQQLEQQAQRTQAEIAQPLLERVKKAIEDIRAEDGYALIFDAPGTGSGVIIAADKNLDVTDRVLARLRTMAATSPAAPGTPTRPAAGPVAAPAGATRPRP